MEWCGVEYAKDLNYNLCIQIILKTNENSQVVKDLVIHINNT